MDGVKDLCQLLRSMVANRNCAFGLNRIAQNWKRDLVVFEARRTTLTAQCVYENENETHVSFS